MSIADVIILIVISLGIYHFLTKRKVPKDGRSNEKKQVPGVEKDKRENIQEKAPVIRVIFQVENTEEDDLAKEIADMFLDGRTYYYSGKKPEETKEKILFSKHICVITGSSFDRGYAMIWEDIEKISRGEAPGHIVNQKELNRE